jgi:transmembrane sensor
MQKQSREDRKRQAAEQAALWLERLERTIRGDEATSLREWLKAPLNREVIIDRCKLWHGIEVLAILGTLIPDDVASSRLPPQSSRIGSALAWTLAICCVGFSTCVLLGGPPWMAFKVDKKAIRLEEFYRTPRGGRLEVDLPDSARITLNTATTVFVNYGSVSRDAALVRGEAIFDVPRDASRPFHLSVGGRVIETEGARFNLRRLAAEKSEITVLEGAVTVLHPSVSARKTPAQLRDSLTYSYGEATLLAADGGVLAPEWQSVSRLTKSATQARLAWRQGLIIFADEPLQDALAEVARYADREFVFADPGVRNVRLNGEFRTGDLDSVLRVLRDDLRIESRLDEQDRIVLATRPKP